MARGPAFRTIPGGYGPAPTGFTYHVKVTTAANSAQRLGTLSAVPAVPDEAKGGSDQRGIATRPPNHLWIQVPVGAANPIYVSTDNNTTPVVGGPGIEVAPGATLKLDSASEIFLQGSKKFGDVVPFTVNALSSIQIIATVATAVLLHYFD
jgi:hypothetical protein